MQITLDAARKLILENDNFVILTHKNPDGDTLGSSLALCLALRAMDKTAYILENEGITARYIPRISPYFAPDDFAPRFVIAVDSASGDMLSQNCSKYKSAVDLAIDHHVSHKEYAEVTVLDPDAAACGEIIWQLVNALDVPVSRELAEAVYIAIATDTSCFLNANTTARTHEIAAQLLLYNIDFAKINREFFTVKTRARLEVEAHLISTMNFYLNGAVAVMKLSDEKIASVGASEDDLDNLSALARSIEGVELGILLRERGAGCAKASMRSSEKVDVSALCAHFGGGGHVRAAGATFAVSLSVAEDAIISKLNELYPNGVR